MAEDVIQAKRIELLDSQGNKSMVLEAEANGHASLMISAPGEGAPIAMINLDRESGNAHILLEEAHSGAHIFASVDDGRAYIRLRNADGTQMTISPQ